MTHTGEEIAIVALLGLVGTALGVAVTGLAGQRYLRTVEVILPANTEASHVVAMTRGEHPDVRSSR